MGNQVKKKSSLHSINQGQKTMVNFYKIHKKQKHLLSKTLSYINHTNVFLGQSPKAIEIKAKINKWDIVKFTSFCTAKETVNKTKRQPTEWEKIFANDMNNNGLVSKLY